MGSDSHPTSQSALATYFNPRSPCGERRVWYKCFGYQPIFQSTLPVWGATNPNLHHPKEQPYFNPRSPCGERRARPPLLQKARDFNPRSPCGERQALSASASGSHLISIHAPRVGSDGHDARLPRFVRISIHAPRVGSDYLGLALFQTFGISIHAPRVGSDPSVLGACCRGHNFNPRSPCGERPYTAARHAYHRIFQSTLPVWGATTPLIDFLRDYKISIHAPRVGSDSIAGDSVLSPQRISIHAPRVGSDRLTEVRPFDS